MVETPSTDIELGSRAPQFSLPNTNSGYGGDTVVLEDLDAHRALLVVFMCNHCPYVVHIIAKLVDVIDQYQTRGLAAVAVSANDITTHPADAPEKMSEMATSYGFSFPYLYDESQQTARAYGAVCTPDLFLYDGENKLVYHGQFDGSRPGNKQPVTGVDLTRAIDSVLNGAPVPSTQIPSVGCNIKWKAGQAP